jgi:hypothetical protein
MAMIMTVGPARRDQERRKVPTLDSGNMQILTSAFSDGRNGNGACLRGRHWLTMWNIAQP